MFCNLAHGQGNLSIYEPNVTIMFKYTGVRVAQKKSTPSSLISYNTKTRIAIAAN